VQKEHKPSRASDVLASTPAGSRRLGSGSTPTHKKGLDGVGASKEPRSKAFAPATVSSPQGPTKKDGTPDMRFKANKMASPPLQRPGKSTPTPETGHRAASVSSLGGVGWRGQSQSTPASLAPTDDAENEFDVSEESGGEESAVRPDRRSHTLLAGMAGGKEGGKEDESRQSKNKTLVKETFKAHERTRTREQSNPESRAELDQRTARMSHALDLERKKEGEGEPAAVGNTAARVESQARPAQVAERKRGEPSAATTAPAVTSGAFSSSSIPFFLPPRHASKYFLAAGRHRPPSGPGWRQRSLGSEHVEFDQRAWAPPPPPSARAVLFAAPHRADPSRADPSRADPSRADPSRADPSRGR